MHTRMVCALFVISAKIMKTVGITARNKNREGDTEKRQEEKLRWQQIWLKDKRTREKFCEIQSRI